jgi:hypothetical protein
VSWPGLFAILVLLLLATFSFAGTKHNPADYNIDVHVSASHREANGGPRCFLNVTITGKQYELAGSCPRVDYDPMILALGDYKAKLVTDEHPSPYQSYQVFEFLLPDDKTLKFEVVGLTE